MRKLVGIAAVAACLAASPARADVQLTIHNGLVTLNARDATVRQILAEWARVGRTTVVNGEKISGAPLTIQLTNIPEKKALEILLRTLSGYVAAPRPMPIENASHFDRIIVMPTTASARPATAATPAAPARAPFMPPPPPVEEPQNEPQDPNAAVQNTPPPGTPRPPVFTTFPTPEVAQPPQSGSAPAAPTAAPQMPVMVTSPTAPPGVAAPGIIVPAQTGSPNSQPPQQTR